MASRFGCCSDLKGMGLVGAGLLFTLTALGQTTDDIAYNADAGAVAAALEAVLPFSNTNHPGAYGRVNPFNPCLPNPQSRTCQSHPGFDQRPAPFDDSVNWLSLN